MKLRCFALTAIVSLTFVGSASVGTKHISDLYSNEVVSYMSVENDKAYDVQPAGLTDISTSVTNNEPKTYMQAFFNGLINNMGMNYKGSCSYVAIGMLLSYYDTYLNDSIIPEQYDAVSLGYERDMVYRHNSPGIVNDVITQAELNSVGGTSIEKLSPQQYYSIISSKANYSLHAKLITIGESKGYYDYNVGEDGYPCGLNLYNGYNVLKEYLDQIGLKNKYTLKIKPYIVNSVAEKHIKQSIDAGQPVIVALRNTKTGASHACIAYSYNENDIYVNMGWRGGNAHVAISSRYDKYVNAITIEWNLNHTHSNNYGVRNRNIDGSISTSYYCYDDSNIVTWGHRHIYMHSYSQYNSLQHKAICSCGSYIYEDHYYGGISPAEALSVNSTCTKCGYVKSGGGTVV